MPEEAKPKGPRGQFSWTAHTTVGPLHRQCSIEAILRNKGWRVAKPKMTKEEEPFTPWNVTLPTLGRSPSRRPRRSSTRLLTRLSPQ
eukprot:2685124-Pyramimonas_sp.AAC.1